jgi:hypothetical protein
MFYKSSVFESACLHFFFTMAIFSPFFVLSFFWLVVCVFFASFPLFQSIRKVGGGAPAWNRVLLEPTLPLAAARHTLPGARL